MVALAAVAASVVLQAGQVQWFMPGTLEPGQKVVCGVSHPFSTRVPTSDAADWAWKGGFMSIRRSSNGAVEAACNTRLPGPRIPTIPYVIGQNGLALIRGANHLSQLEQRYGSPTRTLPSSGGCIAVWRHVALQATFTSCAGNGALVRAAVSSTRWSSLSGVSIGDPLARVLFEAPYVKNVGNGRWRLALSHQHSLVASIDPDGRVARLVATLR